MSDFSEREQCDFFGYLALLSIEERNDLDEYLRGLPEFKQWDDAGTLLRLKEKVLKASAGCGATAEAIDEAYDEYLRLYSSYRGLHGALRRRAKDWCHAMV